MAASKPITDDAKVMDVAKPGKGKVVGTSRPVVSPIVSDSKASNIEVKDDDKKVEEVKLTAPSESRKVIQPLGDVTADDESDTPAETTEPTEPVSDSPVIESTVPKAKKAEPEATPEPEAKDPEPEKAPEASDDETSESASVDALAAQAETKKQAAKRAEEEAKKDAALKEIIDSKKYHVPISSKLSNPGGHHVTWVFVVIVLVISVLISAYILADAGVIESPVALPFDLIK